MFLNWGKTNQTDAVQKLEPGYTLQSINIFVVISVCKSVEVVLQFEINKIWSSQILSTNHKAKNINIATSYSANNLKLNTQN